MTLRRLQSFQRMDSIIGRVDDWFFSNAALAQLIDDFVNTHCTEFRVDEDGVEENDEGEIGFFIFSPDDPDDRKEDQRKRSHRRKEVHNQFNLLFETELEKFVISQRVTADQFQNVFKISQEEELWYGGPVYRWIDATEYSVFLATMQNALQRIQHGYTGDLETPMDFLRDQIAARVDEAKHTLRRRKRIRPLLDKWDLDDFNLLVQVLQRPECSPTGSNTKQDRKFLARWRIKLLQEQRENGNKTDRNIMTEYVGRFVEEHSDDAFERLLAYLHSYVDSLPLDETGRRRRAAWELFAAMDRDFTGSVPFEKVLQFLDKYSGGRSQSKEWKKVIVQWAARIKKNIVDQLEMQEHEFVAFVCDLLQNMDLEKYEELVNQWVQVKLDLVA